jgi:hypothetical protein
MMRASASRSRGRRSSLRGGGGGGEATPTSCSPATETRRHRAAKNGAGRVLIHCIALGSCPLCASLAPRCANADGRRWVAECSRRRRRGRGCQGWWRAKRGAAETRTCCACCTCSTPIIWRCPPVTCPACLMPHASRIAHASGRINAGVGEPCQAADARARTAGAVRPPQMSKRSIGGALINRYAIPLPTVATHKSSSCHSTHWPWGIHFTSQVRRCAVLSG